MSNINTGSFPADLLPGLIKRWFGDYKDLAPLYQQFMQLESSNQAYDVFATSIPLGVSRLTSQGGDITFDTSMEDFKVQIKNLMYTNGFEITKAQRMNGNAFRDTKRFTEQLRRSDRVAREIVAAGIPNHAGSSGYVMTPGDGVVLASASHPILNGTRSNILSGAPNLSEAALEAMSVQAKNAVDRRGLHISVALNTLLINPAMGPDAHRILKSTKQVDSANNTASYVYDTSLIKKVVENTYLSSTTQWQVTTDQPDGLIFVNRQDPMIDTDNVFLNKNSQVSVDSYFAAGWLDDLGIYVSLA